MHFYARLLQLSGDYQVSELRVEPNDWLANERLSKLNLPDEGIVVLGIHRQDGTYIGAPMGKTRIRPKDVLVLYGRLSTLSELNTRRANIAGDFAHQDAIAKQRQVLSEQNRNDIASRD